MRERILLSWSSGKDSAWSLYRLRTGTDYEVVGLLTTVTEPYERVSMHGVRRNVLKAQAAAAGLPLIEVLIPAPSPNEIYEERMAAAMAGARDDTIGTVAFGDLFLEDIREYRESKLATVGMRAVFPLWLEPTEGLAREMVAGGLRAMVVCVDPRQLDASFAGRNYDEAFLRDLPPGVDPCGENGEFHTLVVGGPIFDGDLNVTIGETVEREGFVFADVSLAS
ncbi:MAG: adenine nucleotide alpha hydrolase [Proteobacteria bacterium]|nr:adenine nucleotide alpha hydrolase [Pseudomonadota bacterium]MDA1058497.1 adenine nucleotide alpha hydrolase [Pseudomonadota bacterium]